jgi:predicted peroxiredoxin
MTGKFCVALAHAKDDTDKATVAFVIANAAVASQRETVVFLGAEGVHLAVKGYADDVHVKGFAPLKELISSFVAGGGTVYVGSMCFKQRGLHRRNLIGGARLVGGARLFEFLASGVPCISY